jgi:hypothetical protein
MSVTVEQLREMIDGLSDETEVSLNIHLTDSVDELTDVQLTDALKGSHGEPRIAVTVGLLDDEDDEDWDGEDDDYPDEPPVMFPSDSLFM